MSTDFPAAALGALALATTQQAARSCVAWVGLNDKNAADGAAVRAMTTVLNDAPFAFRVAIGEGELDSAPQLAPGDVYGLHGGPVVDVAVDPLEGTSLCAEGRPGAVSTIAFAGQGALLAAPDGYMMKVMAGPSCPDGLIRCDIAADELAVEYARATGKPLADVTVCILDKPRHHTAIAAIRSAGANVLTIPDADIPAALWVCDPDRFGVDLYWGIGGAPEAVVSAAALNCLSGKMAARFMPRDGAQRARLDAQQGLEWDRPLSLTELVRGDTVFAMSSITGTKGLAPAQTTRGGIIIESYLVTPGQSSPVFSNIML